MNIHFKYWILINVCLCGILPAHEYTGKQKAILLLNATQNTPWLSTAVNPDIDPLFVLQPSLLSHPGLPGFATAFISRNPRVAELSRLINQELFEDTSLAPFLPHTRQATIQEHICGIQLGQLWHQENFDIGWNWWIGARERNWWLSQQDRENCNREIQNYTASMTKEVLQDRYAAPEVNHRLTYWHATGTTVGIGDVHLYIRYRLPLTNALSCSAGFYTTIPIGTRATRTTPQETEDLPPLNNDELATRLINRARDCMLCAPLGSNGHAGLGFQCTGQLQLTKTWSLRGQFTQIYYRSGIESRFSLQPKTALSKLEEGMPGNMEGISSDADIITHLKQKLYPCEIKVEVQPGMTQTASAGIHYEASRIYGMAGYLMDHMQHEYSETAPLATLTRTSRKTQRIAATLGIKQRYYWGECSWYTTGTYALKGSAQDAWNCGVGVTVQG
jgi:hypothetical protein